MGDRKRGRNDGAAAVLSATTGLGHAVATAAAAGTEARAVNGSVVGVAAAVVARP